MKGKRAAILLLILLPLAVLGYLYYALETYGQITHNESGFFVQAFSIMAFIPCAFIWLKNRKRGILFTLLGLYALILLAGCYFIGGKIPFCVECDQVTKEELGFLTHWISPMD